MPHDTLGPMLSPLSTLSAAFTSLNSALIHPEVDRKVEALELPFNRLGIDPYGISKKHLKQFFSMLRFFYKDYFKVETHGLENIPQRGRAMLVGNHSGGFAIDAALVMAAMMLEMQPPRLVQAMAEKFLNRLPFASSFSSRTGQFTGLPEHASRLLEEERLLMVFPEGARGTAKLYVERHSLVRFGTGFMRLALSTRTPIIPFACLGGGEALPTIANAEKLGHLMGLPYVPITPYLLPIPLPVRFDLFFGAPMRFEGTGTEDDELINRNVDLVKERIATMIDAGRHSDRKRKHESKESFR
jgi:1-acyl-sn-glycerol-3-phosphate acyltransferase